MLLATIDETETATVAETVGDFIAGVGVGHVHGAGLATTPKPRLSSSVACAPAPRAPPPSQSSGRRAAFTSSAISSRTASEAIGRVGARGVDAGGGVGGRALHVDWDLEADRAGRGRERGRDGGGQGDGGTMLGLAEMITAVDENAPLVYVLMNDQLCGVIQNIQDAQYDSRRHYSKVAVPDFATFCQAISMPHTLVRSVEDFPAALDAALAADGPQVVEIDMIAIGPFAESSSGPPAGAAGNKV